MNTPAECFFDTSFPVWATARTFGVSEATVYRWKGEIKAEINLATARAPFWKMAQKAGMDIADLKKAMDKRYCTYPITTWARWAQEGQKMPVPAVASALIHLFEGKGLLDRDFLGRPSYKGKAVTGKDLLTIKEKRK